jgi:lysyl-tRNA synthetase class 2
MAQIDEIKKAKLEKLELIRKKGWNPYASKFDKKHSVVYALEHEGERIITAGKLMSFREHGDITFADLRDSSGKIQLFFKKDELGDEAYENTKLLDVGDYVGVEGAVGRTQAGEISIFVSQFTLLTKSILPHPNEWYGLKDTETRYRKRYLDLIMNEDVKKIFETRSKVVHLLRNYMDNHGFLEVETPILQPLYGGASANPFKTHYNALDSEFYLRIAVELYLKRLVVGGFEKVYELGKDFRNEGFSRQHNPEFSMLEFYWAYADYNDLMKFTEEMLTHVIQEVKGNLKVQFEGKEFDFTAPWPRKQYSELFEEYLGFSLKDIDTEEKLKTLVEEKKWLDEPVIGYGRMLDEVYKKHIRPQLHGPMFLIDHPVELKPLAKRREDDPSKSAGFQLLVSGMEFINAYNELNDPIDQKARWEEDMKVGARGGEDFQVVDEDYIEALSYGMPPTAGWGMGIDRLTAFLTDQHAIKDVILFPTMKPENSEKVEKKSAVVPVVQPKQSVPLKITREKALEILETHIQNKNLRNHCKAVEATMRALARKFGANEDVWGIAGLLHDADWEETTDAVEQHTHKTIQWIKDAGEDNEELIDIILTHNYQHNGYRAPQTTAEWALFTCDELTGFIVAVALVRPEKKLELVEVKSVLKKFPAVAFAKPVDREQIRMCEEKLGIPLEEFVDITLSAMKEISQQLGL